MDLIKVILMENSNFIRNALENILFDGFNVDIIGEATSSDELLKLHKLHLADIILLEDTIIYINGILAIKEILRKHPTLKFIAVVEHCGELYKTLLKEVVLKGCIYRNSISTDIIEVISSVKAGNLYFQEEIILRSGARKSNTEEKGSLSDVKTWNILIYPKEDLVKKDINMVFILKNLFALGEYKISNCSPIGHTSEFWNIFLITAKPFEEIDNALASVREFCKIAEVANFNIFEADSLKNHNQ